MLLPTEGLVEEQTQVDVVPWLDRKRRGRLVGWITTVGLALGMPRRLAGAIPVGRGTGAALGFLVVTSFVYLAIGLAVPALAMAALTVAAGQFGALVLLLIGPLLLIVAMVLWALCTHLILALTGGTPRGVSGTLACACYASGANVLLAIPCLSFYMIPLAWIWSAIALSIMLIVAQRVSALRGILAAVIPPLLLVLTGVGLVGFAIWTTTQQVAAMAATQSGSVAATMAIEAVTDGIMEFVEDNEGSLPPHGVALVADRHLSISDLYSSGMPAAPDRMVAGVDLIDLVTMSQSDKTAAVERAAGMLPDGVIAHRVGDVVFAYHGIDMVDEATDPRLWICVLVPESGAGPATLRIIRRMVMVGRVDGQTEGFSSDSWPEQLNLQNALRAKHGLAPLPDPLGVSQDAPVAATTGLPSGL
ncbi:MAG: YIP1 family protein [Phycisphaeraceae bacterium]|nr:YIP1 family protein [Phycisphaeraceae bacterium]